MSLNRLLIFALLAIFLSTSTAGLSQGILTGYIRDASNQEPLAGASVVIKGTNTGVSTEPDGSFELRYEKPLPLTLSISFIGYEKREVIVNSNRAINLELRPDAAALNEVIVTSRRRNEEVQEVPIPISVLNTAQIENTVSFNINRVKELLPAVQLYSSNPRNTTLNIRGLGSTFGLTNDGIDPGVGFYVDGVYYARPAATTIDFIDVQQLEVLRGPQGTLFGKNTTAGALNITTRKP
ncbi:MAG TPA: carboxypeptidase-like regulatory domain-containing protein, partial [Cyclobacteriaceae bacterium]|nr:carboxypeptidase-like regulatory domain-containing protein [Cyclobacteriaceae bacterium]